MREREREREENGMLKNVRSGGGLSLSFHISGQPFGHTSDIRSATSVMGELSNRLLLQYSNVNCWNHFGLFCDDWVRDGLHLFFVFSVWGIDCMGSPGLFFIIIFLDVRGQLTGYYYA